MIDSRPCELIDLDAPFDRATYLNIARENVKDKYRKAIWKARTEMQRGMADIAKAEWLIAQGAPVDAGALAKVS